MNTKLLKQKILDLAIRGKLTQQLKSDGTAADLLKEIADAKSALSQPKGKKSKNLGQIIPLDKSEAPFEIPANWEWVRLGDVGKWQSGTTPSKSNSAYYKDGTIPWLNTGDLNDGIINDIPKRVTEKALAETSLRLNEAGSVCIAMYGATIGKLGILSMPATTNQACCVCNNLKSFVNRMWLFFFLMNHKQEFIEAGFGGAQPNISKEKIVSTMFPLPPLAEQQRIVAKIEEAFAEIDAIEKNKELLKTHIKQTRQKILDLAIHGKLVPQNKSDEPASVLLERITRDNPHYEKIGLDDVPFDIPKSWCWCRLGDVLNIARGGSPRPIQDYLTNEKDGLNWIKIGDTEKGGKYIETVKEKIKPSGLSHTRAVKAGDFLLTNSMSFGRPYILKVDGCIHDGWLVLGNVEKSMIPDFLYFMLSSDFIYQSFAFAAAGSTVKNLKSETVQGTLFPLPPLNEQSRIVEKIEELFSVLDKVTYLCENY